MVQEPAPKWRLVLLGPLSLESRDGACATTVLRQPKRTALLAFLGTANGGALLRRDQIMDRFWPRSDALRARTSLRQSLSFLRRSLGPQVLVQRGYDEVGLNPDWMSCDVQDFRAAVNRGDHQAALEQYGGEFMHGLVVEGANGFNDWLDTQRAMLRSEASASAWALAKRFEAEGHFDMAGFWARRALALQPFDESGAQRLIRLLDRIGDRSGALRVFRGLEQRLEEEFNAKPSPESVALIKAVQTRASLLPGPGPEASKGRRGDGERRSGQERRSWVGSSHAGPERRSGEERRNHINRRSTPDRRRD